MATVHLKVCLIKHELDINLYNFENELFSIVGSLYSDSELNNFSLKNVELRLRFQRHHCELGMLLFFLKGSLRLDSPILKRMLKLQRQFNLKKTNN